MSTGTFSSRLRTLPVPHLSFIRLSSNIKPERNHLISTTLAQEANIDHLPVQNPHPHVPSAMSSNQASLSALFVCHKQCDTSPPTVHDSDQFCLPSLRIFNTLWGPVATLKTPRESALQSASSHPRSCLSREKRRMDAMLPCYQQDNNRACASSPTAAPPTHKSPRPARHVT